MKNFLKAVFVLIISIAAFSFLWKTLHTVHFTEVQQSFASIPLWIIWLAMLFTILNYFILIAYDNQVIQRVIPDFSWEKNLWVSLFSYTFSYNLGVLVGGSLRGKLYQSLGFSGEDLIKIFTQTYTFFWTGFALITGVSLLLYPIELSSFYLVIGSRILGILLVLTSMFALWIQTRKNQQKLPQVIALSLLDWLCAGLVFITIFTTLIPEMSIGSLLSIFLIAQIAGLLSNIPGGMGAFEAVFIALLPGKTLSGSLLAGLLLYRVIYYFFPLVINFLLWGGAKIYNQYAKNTVWKDSLSLLNRFTPSIFTYFVYFAGFGLLLSSAFSTIPDLLNPISPFLKEQSISLSNFTSSVVGLLLIFFAIGLQKKSQLAYILTLGLLLIGAGLSLIRGWYFEEAFLLISLSVLLYGARANFLAQRINFTKIMNWQQGVILLFTLLLIVFINLFLSSHQELKEFYFWEIFWHFSTTPINQILIGSAIFILFFGLLHLLQPQKNYTNTPSAEDTNHALFLTQKSDDPNGYLALLKDKFLFFNREKNAFLMYGVSGKHAVVMGDPIGVDESHNTLLLKDFVVWCEDQNLIPIFYEVSQKYLGTFAELGFTAFKLGEEALVHLSEFSLEGKKNKNLRNTLNSLDAEGYYYKVITGDEVSKYMPDLKTISDRWLEQKNIKEMGFSLGFFDEEYLQKCPIAIIFDRNDTPLAFANLLITNLKKECSIDLMRYHPEKAPENIMLYLFLQLITWSKEENYQYFSLGMAPLSGLETNTYSPWLYQVGKFIFEHSKRFYNFKGLRNFKNKFRPEWEARYFIVPRYTMIIKGLLQVRKLTNTRQKE